MAAVFDQFDIDTTNREFQNAFDLVTYSDELIYLTGKAGTGKTTFLKYLKANTTKKMVVLAPTGVAAVNANGQTIHSFFQIRPGIYPPEDKKLRTKADRTDPDQSTIYNHFKYTASKLEIIRNLELLVIDEISMVRCDLLDLVDKLLRVFRKKHNEAFGGVQVLLIGDIFQLPPIAPAQEWQILQKFYSNLFFFSSNVIRQHQPVYIELKKIYRQNEPEFIELLNNVRVNNVSTDDLQKLNSKYQPDFEPDENSNYITLATHNADVTNINQSKLEELPGDIVKYEATVTGKFPEDYMPTEKILQLKVGAQVMFLRNDWPKNIFNGKIAIIEKLEEDKLTVWVSDEEKSITIERYQWDNIDYSWDEKEKKIKEEITGSFRQFPVRLAWAITVHKSQGLTFEKVIADLANSFTSGQVYVALSRCTNFDGLVLKSKIESRAIKTDYHVIEYSQNETEQHKIDEKLKSGKADFYYKLARESVIKRDFPAAYENLIKAINLRNDIESEEFKRYFIIMASRLCSRKNIVNQHYDTDDIDIEINEPEDFYEIEVDDDEEFWEEEKSELLQQINTLQSLLAEKQTKLDIIERKCFAMENELVTLQTKLITSGSSIMQLQRSEEENLIQIRNLEQALSNSQEELNKLRNKKWYQILFK